MNQRHGDVLYTYFNGGPVSLNIIEPKLYLGNLSAARDLHTLNSYKITHIITIDKHPLPQHIQDVKHITKMYIELLDQPSENLLQYFDETYDFITEGMKEGNVYVHCYFGVSRSASVIIAFIMKKYRLTYFEAFKRVKQKRPQIYPNQGFVKQLQLYYKMKYIFNKDDMNYKVMLLTIASEKIKRYKVLPQNCKDFIKRETNEGAGFRCKKCRRWLARDCNLITHCDATTENLVCNQMYFLEPLVWMEGVDQVIEGKLCCPKCHSKVGSFDWSAGCKCPCGSQVTPAFYICPSKVDHTKIG